MPEKPTTVKELVKPYVPHIIAGVALVAGTYLATKRYSTITLPPGKFISKAEFQHMLDTDDVLVLLTPLGKFRVTPA